jgi:hypothetical protein
MHWEFRDTEGRPRQGPKLSVMGRRTCELDRDLLLPHVAAAYNEFLGLGDRQTVRDFDGGVLVVTSQLPGQDVRQLLLCLEDIPYLSEETQSLVRRLLAEQEAHDTRRELEQN